MTELRIARTLADVGVGMRRVTAALVACAAATGCVSSDGTKAPSPDASTSIPSDGGFTQLDANAPPNEAAIDGSDGAAPLEDATIDSSSDDAAAFDDGGVTSISLAPTQLDLVGKSDAALQPDGTVDQTFDVTIVGPITALALVTTDANGTMQGQEQWDTIVGSEAMPKDFGSPWSSGDQTWILGVFVGTTAQNDPSGALSLPAGTHAVTLVCGDDGHFVSGQHFRLWARRPDGSWQGGPTYAYP